MKKYIFMLFMLFGFTAFSANASSVTGKCVGKLSSKVYDFEIYIQSSGGSIDFDGVEYKYLNNGIVSGYKTILFKSKSKNMVAVVHQNNSIGFILYKNGSRADYGLCLPM